MTSYKFVVSLTTSKELAPSEHVLSKDKIMIGRSAENDIPLPDNEKRVSSKHARVEREGTSLQITDLGSTNGTFVNGRKIDANSAVELKDGDKLSIGLYSLLVTAEEEDSGDRTMVLVDPSRQLAQLVDELPVIYARHSAAPEEQRRRMLRGMIQSMVNSVGPDNARSILMQLRSRFRPADGGVVPERTTAIRRKEAEVKAQESFSSAGMRVMGDLSAQFVGEGKLETTEQADLFGKLLANVLELTFDWISKSLRGRKEFEEQFSADLSMIFSKEKNPLKGGGGPGDMGRYLLDWRVARDPKGIRDALDNAFKDLTMHQLGLLAGVQESLSAVLKRLDPKVVEQEGKEMGKGGFLASSEKKAWKRYSEVFHEIFAENSKLFNELIYPNVRKGYLALHDNDAKAGAEKKGDSTKKGPAAPPSITQRNPAQ
ncbi:MAG TPA: type VI secretion system-associated FHA domain protein TagH [Planctomycetota bacterium]|nr:type VI secretion system-associated FHA domain protein TagH [Planctomycetota bacterium]